MAKLLINTFLFLLIILVVIMAGCVSEKTRVATLPKSHQFVESIPYIVSHHPKLYKEHLKERKNGIDWSKTEIDTLQNKFLVARIKEKERRRVELLQNSQSSKRLYFGHEKKPKKRTIGKRVFCKECHIVH
jgi:hypothetical protein